MPFNGQHQRRILKDNRPFQRVPGEGPKPCELMIIGERPGENEAREGRPFIGLAGKWLNIGLEQAGIDRAGVYITNLVKTYEEYAKPTRTEIERDQVELWEEIVECQPRVIALMGTFAVEEMLGRDRAGLERTHGVPVRGREEFGSGIVWVPCFHPAAGIWNTDSLPHILSDLRSVGMTLSGDLAPREDPFAGKEKYQRYFGSPGMKEYSGNPAVIRATAGVDTEGWETNPWCTTFSVQPGSSWLVKAKERVHFEGLVYLWNSMHDLGVLRAMGTYLRDDQFRDLMIYAYLLKLEPQGLKDSSYRHNAMEMMSYEEVIGDADRDVALAYLEGASGVEWSPAKEILVFENGKARISRPHSINQRIEGILRDVYNNKVNKYGVPTDPRKRWNDIEDYLKLEVIETLGDMPEATLDDVPVERAEAYANRDSDATLRNAPILEAKIDEMGLREVADIDHSVVPMFDRMQYRGIKLEGKEFWDKLEARCDEQMGKAVHAIYELTGYEINPDSPKQTSGLLFEYLKLPVIKWTSGGEKGPAGSVPSTTDKALEAIVALHPVVDHVLVYREASKIKSSYVSVLRRIATRYQGDHRAHSTFRLTRVESGRPSATKPNLLAIPARSDLGREIRGGFVASDDDHLICDNDLDQAEMRWMADESRDARLVNLFLDGTKDVHSETAALMFSIRVGDVVKTQRYAAKRVGFGVITGITEHGLLDQMALARAKRPDGEPWTLDDCEKMISAYFEIYPAVKLYMQDAAAEAEKFGYVRDRWGRLRYLPGIWSPIKAVREEAARQASSHKIQAGAQGYMKVCQAAIWKHLIRPLANDCRWDEMWPVEPLLQIYDSLICEVHKGVAEFAQGQIIGHLTQTVKTRTGLPMKAKGGLGRSWLEVKD
jgi:uracil-DNA glycosylase family 4